MDYSEMSQNELWKAYFDLAMEMDDAFVSGNYKHYLECKNKVKEIDKYIED